MIFEKKEILLPEEILKIKNWDEKNQIINAKILSPNVDSAINVKVFKENKDAFIKLKTKKPSKYFSKVYLIVDIGCDILDEKFEIIVYYGDNLVYENIFSIQKNIITRYKTKFKIEHKNFKSENFIIVLKLLPSKKENIKYGAAFTIFSVFIETVTEDQKNEKILETTTTNNNNNSIEIAKNIYMKNFWYENKKNLIKLLSKSNIVVYTTIKKYLNEISKNHNYQKLLTQIKFTIIQTKTTKKINSKFNIDCGIISKKLFDNFDNFEDIQNNVFGSKTLLLSNYRENFTVEWVTNYDSIENIVMEDELINFFTLRDMDNLEDFYITDIDFLISLKN